MGARKRVYAAFNSSDELRDGVGTGQRDNRVHHRERILGTMIHLAGKEHLALLGLFAIGDVDGNTADTRKPVDRITARRSRAKAPSHPTVGTTNAKFNLTGIGLSSCSPNDLANAFPIVAMNQFPNRFERHLKGQGIDTKDTLLPVVPGTIALHEVPIPRPHLAGRQCQIPPLLALLQAPGRALRFRGSLGDPALEFGVELFELSRFSVQFGKYLHLGAQHLRNDRNGHVVDRTHLIATETIHVGQENRRNEDDCRLTELRMVADHGGEFEPVQFGHADVHKDDGDIHFKQIFECLPARRRLDQVHADVLQNDLVAQQLGRLIVNQKDIHLIVAAHGALRVQRCSHMRKAESSCSVLTGFAR